MSWLGRLFRRERLERELDRELRFHVETRAAELRATGVPASEAHRRALAEFGGIEPIKEQARDARGTRWLEDAAQDVRYALRLLRSNKGFAAAAILSLAVGIGANAAVFRVIDGLILRPLPVERPQELFLIESSDRKESSFSRPAVARLEAAAPSVSFATYTTPTNAQVMVNGTAELRPFELVSGHWFDLLGVEAAAGRLIGPADDDLSAPAPVAVLSERFWERNYARAASAIGSTLVVNNVTVTVIGVARDFTGIHVGQSVELWLPAAMQFPLKYRSNAFSNNADDAAPWGTQDGIAWLAFMGRAPREAQPAVLDALNAQYKQIVAERVTDIQDLTRRERNLRDHLSTTDISRGVSRLRQTLSPALTVLMGMVALVLLVACANLANLLLARGAARGREFALRLSIGARRGRLVRQLLTESVTLALIGGLAGLLVSAWAAPALLRLVSATSSALPVAMPFDFRLLAFGIAASIVTGMLFGLLPALRLSRPAVQDSLKTGGRVVNAGARRGRPQLAKALVAVQVAMSMLLIVGAALFVQTFRNYLGVDLGIDRTRVYDARFDARLAGYEERELPGLYARLREATASLPGVESVSLSVVGSITGSHTMSTIDVAGYERAPNEQIVVEEEFVAPDYFRTLGIQLLAGREFDSRDTADGRPVAVISESMAKKYFAGRDPVGATFGDDGPDELQVVGIVSDVRASGLKDAVPSLVYYPIAQVTDVFARNLYVRASRPSDTLPLEVQRAINRVAPNLAVREVVTMDELAERTVSAERMVSRLTVLFGILGVAVACLGLYGTIAYSVARRTNEIGVRLALGASPGGVRWMVVRETLWLAVIGAVIGLGLAMPLGRMLSSQLYGLSANDPATLAGSAALVVVIGFLAGAVPAWRASRVNPTAALRAD